MALIGSAVLGGSVGLGVEGIDVGHATSHVEVDDVLGLAVRLGDRFGRFGRGKPRGGGSAQGHAEGGAGRVGEEAAA